MKVDIRLATHDDLKQYTSLLQETYENSYTNEGLGLTKDLFSKEIFNNPITQKYLSGNLINNDNQKCWLAFIGNQLVGSITVLRRDKDYELKGFYIASNYQGKGIGKKLWRLVLNFAHDKNIVLDIYAHNTKTIEIYRKWGFTIDKAKGEFYRHWPEWPKNIQAKCIYMRYKN